MAVYGYCRVSTEDQNLEKQLKALHEAGITDEYIFADKASGKNFYRTEYRKLTEKIDGKAPRLRAGDTLVLCSLDRFGRSYDEIFSEWKRITKEIGANIRVLDMPLLNSGKAEDLDSKFVSELVLQVLSYVAEKERINIRRRQRDGYDAMPLDEKGRRFSAKKKHHVGRQEIKKPANFAEVVEVWRSGGITAVEAMRRTGLKKSTFYRMVKNDGK